MGATFSTGSAQVTAGDTGSSLDLFPISLADYRVLSDKAGETILTNICGSMAQPNTLRYAVSPIADMFKSVNGVFKPVPGQDTSGLSILLQLTESWIMDDNDADGVAGSHCPVSGHMVLRFPNNVQMTAYRAIEFIGRLAGMLTFGATTGLKFNYEIGSLMHSVTNPDNWPQLAALDQNQA